MAKQLSWPHYDTDEMITRDVGIPVSEIIRIQGEPAFRHIESQTVALVSMLDKAVISTGGGAPLDSKNMEELKRNGQLVWLRVSPEEVLKRAGNLKSRPLIDAADPLNSIRRRMDERAGAYAAAHHVIDTDSMTPEAIAGKILALIPIPK